MTPDQILLVRASWPAIADEADALTKHFYAHLFDIDESAARLFSGVDMTRSEKSSRKPSPSSSMRSTTSIVCFHRSLRLRSDTRATA